MIIQGRRDFKYIHGHYASLVVFRKKLQTVSETTALLCHCIAFTTAELFPNE